MLQTDNCIVDNYKTKPTTVLLLWSACRAYYSCLFMVKLEIYSIGPMCLYVWHPPFTGICHSGSRYTNIASLKFDAQLVFLKCFLLLDESLVVLLIMFSASTLTLELAIYSFQCTNQSSFQVVNLELAITVRAFSNLTSTAPCTVDWPSYELT